MMKVYTINSTRPGFTLFLLLTLFSLQSAWADTSAANTALQQGRVDDAARLLQATVASQPSDASAHQLLCRVFYAQEIADSAISECEQAVARDPGSSENQMWLGRAYGLKASHTGPFSGLFLAKKVRLSFERAVQLSPTNVQAASDLGEFYVAAPAIAGGGLDKAQRLAASMQPYSPARAHRLLAFIAEKKKDIGRAETEFKNAVAASRTPQTYVDLGFFYQRQNQPDRAVVALQAALDADRDHDAALVDVASILTDAQRSPELAERVLREYLASPAKSDAAPAFKVHLQLGRLLAHRGDAAGARREYDAALKLAPGYEPARKALKET